MKAEFINLYSPKLKEAELQQSWGESSGWNLLDFGFNLRLSQNEIRQFVSVQMGAETKKKQTIIVYLDDKCRRNLYFGECKKKI